MLSSIIMLVVVVIGIWLLFQLFGFGISLLISVVAWAIAGAVASRIMNNEANWLESILLGLIGGIVGNFVLGLLGVRETVDGIWLVGSIIVGIIGAVIVIFIGRQLGLGAVSKRN